MSETEHIKGKLKSTGKTLKEYFIANECEYTGIEDVDRDRFYEVFFESCCIYKGIVYEIKKTDIDPYEDIFIASDRVDGDIDFEVKFYNGGCGLDEAIETALNKLAVLAK